MLLGTQRKRGEQSFIMSLGLRRLLAVTSTARFSRRGRSWSRPWPRGTPRTHTDHIQKTWLICDNTASTWRSLHYFPQCLGVCVRIQSLLSLWPIIHHTGPITPCYSSSSIVYYVHFSLSRCSVLHSWMKSSHSALFGFLVFNTNLIHQNFELDDFRAVFSHCCHFDLQSTTLGLSDCRSDVDSVVNQPSFLSVINSWHSHTFPCD